MVEYSSFVPQTKLLTRLVDLSSSLPPNLVFRWWLSSSGINLAVGPKAAGASPPSSGRKSELLGDLTNSEHLCVRLIGFTSLVMRGHTAL